ncbi:hypothetical protein [Spirosoma endbachense]|uniref:Uncharacterized protein n=1 Tax=Spirosoma endbachense TaxID=2666025 RepID=A0A6P1VXD7_9BACT|nr:hypothetical protein [Spirosoma endbachense]QHV96457.1 hypothetical protein GJR95_16150 [Spirosoma endbachense]
MKYLSLIVCYFFLFACAPSKKKVCEKIDDGIRTYLEKVASKQNKELTINQLTTIDFEMVGAGRLDTLIQQNYGKKISRFLTLQKTATNQANVRAYQDSVNYYAKLDSLTTLQITTRWRDPKVYYYSKTIVNMTTGDQKLVDTMRYALDKSFKLMPLL